MTIARHPYPFCDYTIVLFALLRGVGERAAVVAVEVRLTTLGNDVGRADVEDRLDVLVELRVELLGLAANDFGKELALLGPYSRAEVGVRLDGTLKLMSVQGSIWHLA